MFCPKCGTENAEGIKFCKSCGAPVAAPAAASAPAAAPAPAPAPAAQPAYAAAGGAPAPTGGSAVGTLLANKKLLILGIVALVVIIAVIVGVVSCMNGGGLVKGTYKVSGSGGADFSLVVADKDEATVDFSGLGTLKCTLKRNGSMDGSIVYDMTNLRYSDGKIAVDDNGNMYDRDGDLISDRLENFQLLAPKGAAQGKIEGNWGFYMGVIHSDGDYTIDMYRIEVSGDGTGKAFGYHTSEGMEPGSLSISDMDSYLDINTNSADFTWSDKGQGRYQAAWDSGSKADISIVPR